MLIIQHDMQLTVEHKQDPQAPFDNKTLWVLRDRNIVMS